MERLSKCDPCKATSGCNNSDFKKCVSNSFKSIYCIILGADFKFSSRLSRKLFLCPHILNSSTNTNIYIYTVPSGLFKPPQKGSDLCNNPFDRWGEYYPCLMGHIMPLSGSDFICFKYSKELVSSNTVSRSTHTEITQMDQKYKEQVFKTTYASASVSYPSSALRLGRDTYCFPSLL